MAYSGIHINPANKGKLHAKLGVGANKKIPAAKLAAARKSKDAQTRKEAIFAENAKKWNH